MISMHRDQCSRGDADGWNDNGRSKRSERQCDGGPDRLRRHDARKRNDFDGLAVCTALVNIENESHDRTHHFHCFESRGEKFRACSEFQILFAAHFFEPQQHHNTAALDHPAACLLVWRRYGETQARAPSGNYRFPSRCCKDTGFPSERTVCHLLNLHDRDCNVHNVEVQTS